MSRICSRSEARVAPEMQTCIGHRVDSGINE
jgi:hypothetical protein